MRASHVCALLIFALAGCSGKKRQFVDGPWPAEGLMGEAPDASPQSAPEPDVGAPGGEVPASVDALDSSGAVLGGSEGGLSSTPTPLGVRLQMQAPRQTRAFLRGRATARHPSTMTATANPITS